MHAASCLSFWTLHSWVLSNDKSWCHYLMACIPRPNGSKVRAHIGEITKGVKSENMMSTQKILIQQLIN